jgi:LacI family transcriptional regulator
MTGINYYHDERPEFEPLEYRFTGDREDPLPEDVTHFAGAIVWADLGCDWIQRLLKAPIKVVNCCFDWQGTPGLVSLGLNKSLSCDLVLSHVVSLSPRQFAVIGVDFADRPHTQKLCRMMVDQAREDGLDSVLYELPGPHPDEDRSRMTEIENEQSLLNFLAGLSRPAAIWCENDFVARMVCNAAQYLEIAVPHQLAVVGSGDYRVAVHYSPSITTLPRPAEEIGYAAAKLLDQWIDDNQTPLDVEVAPKPLLLRQSSVNAVNWDKIRTAREIILSESVHGLTVDRICRRIDLSKVTFTKRYTELYGTTPGADIGSQKAEVAMRLLRESTQTITEIGAAIGFSEQSKFSKFFKRQTGKTPQEYRRSFGQ